MSRSTLVSYMGWRSGARVAKFRRVAEQNGSSHVGSRRWRRSDRRAPRRRTTLAQKPRGKALARQRQDRQAHRQGVGGGGVRAVGRRVEEQIGKRDAGEMLRIGALRAKTMRSGRRPVAPRRRAALVGGSPVSSQRTLPGVCAGSSSSARSKRRQLCIPLNDAKTKALSGKPTSARVGDDGAIKTLAVDRLVARDPHNLFGVENLAFRRDDEPSAIR